jgi:hypothetical protein
MSVEEAKDQFCLSEYDRNRDMDGHINNLIAAVRADTEAKVRAEIAGKMGALANKMREEGNCYEEGQPQGAYFGCAKDVEQLASEIKGKQ